MRKFIVPMLLLTVTGCGQSSLEIEARDIKEKGAALIAKGFEQGARTTQFQAGLQGINPGYVFDGEVIVGTIVKVAGVVRLDGVSGQIQAASQTDNQVSPAPQPANP